MTSAAQTTFLAESSVVNATATASDFSNFRDGSFESLGSFWDDVKTANINLGDSGLAAYWLNMVSDPAQLLSGEVVRQR